MQRPQLLEFDQLPASERLVLITLRARLDDHQGAACVETMYRIACGLAWVERAVAAFESMLAALLAGGRRPFHTLDLTAARVTADEQCLLAFLAAHQLGDRVHRNMRAIWLARPQFRQLLQRRAASFAQTLARSGCTLSSSWISTDPLVHGRAVLQVVRDPVGFTWTCVPRPVEEANG